MNPLLYKIAGGKSQSVLALDVWAEKEKQHGKEATDADGQLLDSATYELRVHPPEVSVDNEVHERWTVVTVDSANRPGSLVYVRTAWGLTCQGHGWLDPPCSPPQCQLQRGGAVSTESPPPTRLPTQQHPRGGGLWARPASTAAGALTLWLSGSALTPWLSGSALQVVQHFTELGLRINSARVSSDGGWFVDGERAGPDGLCLLLLLLQAWWWPRCWMPCAGRALGLLPGRCSGHSLAAGPSGPPGCRRPPPAHTPPHHPTPTHPSPCSVLPL